MATTEHQAIVRFRFQNGDVEDSAVGAADQDQQQAAPAHCTEPTSAPILPPVFPHRATPEVPFPPISPTPGEHVWAHLDTERRQAEPELGRSARVSRGNPLVGSGALGGIRTPNLLIRSPNRGVSAGVVGCPTGAVTCAFASGSVTADALQNGSCRAVR